MGPVRAEWGREGRLGLSGVGEGLGIDWDLATRIGQVGPRGAEWGRVGPSRPVRAEGRGWACIGIQLHDSKTRPARKVGPRGAGSGRVGPSRAE